MVRFIGDIHGRLQKYSTIIADVDESVQIGDFGVGFFNHTQTEFMDKLHADGRHRFIRGNHDDPTACKERPGYIPDGTVDVDRSIMYTGGAWSIDWVWRMAWERDHFPNKSWWADEELTIPELSVQHELFVHHEPRVMITHDCPESVAYEMFIEPYNLQQHKTRTAQAYDGMFQRYQPEIWIFGHWHMHMDTCINGTRFICLGIDRYVDLEV